MNILNRLYCRPKYALVHLTMHFSTFRTEHTCQLQDITFLIVFSELPLIKRVCRAMTKLLCQTVEKREINECF